MTRGFLGNRRGPTATKPTDGTNPWGNGFWAIEFTPAVFNIPNDFFEVYHFTVKGPPGSSLQVYINTQFYDITNQGSLNSWDGNNAIFMMGGQSLFLYWDTGKDPAPTATVYLRQPQ